MSSFPFLNIPTIWLHRFRGHAFINGISFLDYIEWIAVLTLLRESLSVEWDQNSVIFVYYWLWPSNLTKQSISLKFTTKPCNLKKPKETALRCHPISSHSIADKNDFLFWFCAFLVRSFILLSLSFFICMAHSAMTFCYHTHTIHSFTPKSTAVMGGNLSHILYVIPMKTIHDFQTNRK